MHGDDTELGRAPPHVVPYLGPGGAERLEALAADERDGVTGEVRTYSPDGGRDWR